MTTKTNMIYLGADHRGFQLKGKIKAYLGEQGLEYQDFGNDHLDAEDDYPDFAKEVAMRVMGEIREMRENRGIVICGSGVGVSITANKVPGIRCGLGFNMDQVKQAREHDDINCLALPADFIGEEEALDIVDVFLKTPFDNQEKHRRRIEKIE